MLLLPLLVLFVRDFLPGPMHAAVRDRCGQLYPFLREEPDSLATQREFLELSDADPAVTTLCGAAALERLRGKLTGMGGGDEVGARLAGDVPVELRRYLNGGGMDWHRDDALYEAPQFEAVYCVENTSDSKTEWEEDGDIRSEWTPPNSLLVFRAGDGGAKHHVTPVGTGTRSILKFVLVPDGAKRTPAYYELVPSQFWGAAAAPGVRDALPAPE